MAESYNFHFIPNTHWDREWLYNFQETRMFLVEFMDKLLDIFKRVPEYKSYLLDSQTVPIEDYLAIRPEKEFELVQRVKEKRLFIGPWYTLPEEHLVNGESLVRNLLLGHQMAEKYGGVMKVGYSPFSYGQASQMPQIYHGFGIDTILFYHGIQPDESRSEFIFEGADGSQLFASRMGSAARYNFFFNVYRPLVYGKSTDQREYEWQENGLPFHLCGEEHYREHHILLDPLKEFHQENLAKLMQEFKQKELQHITTNHIACMQGMDSTQPDEFEAKTVAEAAKVLKDDTIFHSSLPEWIEAVKSSVKKRDLVILKGERRTPRLLGTRSHLYGDVTSARTRMKRKNAQAERDLQRRAEPFAVISTLLGNAYPKTLLDMAWKYLLKCHPHDSIAGTGVDQIENDMHNRLDQCRNISAGVYRRSLGQVQMQIDNSDLGDNDIALTIFNPSHFRRNDVLTLFIDIPFKHSNQQYQLVDASTQTIVEFQEVSRSEHPAIVRHLGDATMEMHSLRAQIHLPVKDVPSLGYKSFLLRPSDSFSRPVGSLVTAPHTMENQFIKIQINSNGTLDITDKENAHTFSGLHYFQNDGEAGHAWRHVPPALDRVIDTLNDSPLIELLESGPFLASFRVTHKMKVPYQLQEGESDDVRRLDAEGDDAGRSQEMRDLIVSSIITLTQYARGVAIKTVFTNECQDHRLRAMFPTFLNAAVSCAEEPFDVVERPIDRGKDSPWRNTWNPTHPHQRFVDLSDEKVGLAIINDGLCEYEATDDETRTIGLTLLRAFEVALTTVAWRWERHPEMTGSQSPGEHEFRYFIYPHKGNWDTGKVIHQAEVFNLPLQPAQAGRHEGYLPKEKSFFSIEPEDIALSGLKQAEKNDGIILRLFNPTNRSVETIIKTSAKLSHVGYVNLNEEPLEINPPEVQNEKTIFEIKAKKIITLKLHFEKGEN